MDGAGLLQTGATVLLNGAFGWLVGAACSIGWLGHAPVALRRSITLAAVACMAGTFLALLCAVALMGDVGLGEAAGLLPQMLVDTSYGRAALASLLVMSLLLGLSLARTFPVLPAVMLLMTFALARASISHGAGHGLLSVGTMVEWLHLLLVGLWVGVVAVAGWIVVPRADGGGLKAYLGAVSGAATLALAGIVGSGVFNAWQRMESVAQLGTHAYGNALAVKLVLVGIAACLGAYNRFVGFPKAGESPGRAVMVLRIESLVLLAALIAAAVLTLQEPPQ